MKKLLFTFCAALIAVSSFGQCTPDGQYTEDGIYPDTIINLPVATVGVAYATTITALVPADTTSSQLPGTTITIDYYQVDSIGGLPTGFVYTCNPANCRLPGGQASCIEVTSTNPLLAEVGTHPVVVYVTAATNVFGTPLPPQPGTVSGYKIVIDNAVGIAVVNENEFGLMQNIPNPASESTVIGFTDPIRENVDLSIYNVSGQRVVFEQVNAQPGLNRVDVNTSGLSAGIYLYTVSNSSTILSKRMIVTD
ncbi:MAG: T9SS type A sorting domain-containing protein [Flavobacteriales bacterium]|nr:T9SS type A sorting domain-containing protein [Flavobacteriales bacterium]